MKVKATGLLLALAMLVAVFALPAAANQSTGGSAGVFQGQADVGKKGHCDQDGGGATSGGGLGLVNPAEPTQVLINKLAWFTINAPAPSVVDVVHGIGGLRLCGKLGPNVTGLGASCLTTKGWDGQGRADLTNPVTGANTSVHITNLGWVATVGGTFLVTGDAGGQAKKKADQLVAVVQALDELVLVNCLGKTNSADPKNKNGGATTFNVVAAYVIVPGASDVIDDKKSGNPDPKGD